MTAPERGICACGCGVEGPLRLANRHVRKWCKCPSCIGRRNRAGGRAKQTAARHGLGIVAAHMLAGQEESWRDARYAAEVKAGAQVMPCARRFYAAETQSLAAREPGDTRPTVVVLMPEGSTDGIVMVRLSAWAALTGGTT